MNLVTKKQIEDLYIKERLTKAETAKRLGIAKTTLWNYCKEYEIENRSFWTDEEIYYLENNFGLYPVKTISRKLNRTEDAIKGMCMRLGLTSALSNTEYLNTNDIAKVLGIDRKTVWNFIKDKGLPAKKKVILKKGEFWRISIKDFWIWLEKNKSISLAKLEKNILGVEPDWINERRKDDIRANKRHNQNWSEFEVNYLKANYKSKTGKQIAKELNRTLEAVQIKAAKLNLKKLVSLKWQDIEVQMLIDMKFKGLTDAEVAEELGRSLGSVAAKRKDLIKKDILNWKYRETARG